jgi:hypothetical protein
MMEDAIAKKHQDVFVVERYFENAVGIVLGAFMSFDDAQAFSELSMVSCRSPHEVEITRCAPTPREVWRRFADDRRWSTTAWEHRGIGEP